VLKKVQKKLKVQECDATEAEKRDHAGLKKNNMNVDILELNRNWKNLLLNRKNSN